MTTSQLKIAVEPTPEKSYIFNISQTMNDAYIIRCNESVTVTICLHGHWKCLLVMWLSSQPLPTCM